MIYKNYRLATDYNKLSELRAKCKQISKLDYQEFINKSEPTLSNSFHKNIQIHIMMLRKTSKNSCKHK